jgi:RND family efflux transporter MFP subunit
MTYRSGVLTGAAAALLLAGAVAAGWWLLVGKPTDGGKSAPLPIPASVPKVFKEDQAAGVTLTPEAEARLAIRTAPVERKPVGRVRVYGGEVTIPPGQAVVVSAPLAGLLKPAGKATPAAGMAVKHGEPVYQLLPILDPVGRANLTAAKVDADGQVKAAEEQLKAARITLDRAKNVLASGAGSQRMVDEAQAQVDIATKNLEAVKARRDLLDKVVGQAEAGTTTPVPIEAPEDGVLRAVSALPGQTVPAGAALFEVVDLSRVWVRVPVYVGDLADIDTAAPAAVGPLTAKPGDPTRPASPVPAPPAANPAAGTADLFYALDNRETGYRPGQRVGATLPLKGPADGLVVPWAAVVYDVHGGAWVYEKTGDRAYARRRVVVRYAVGETAVLASGPPAGTPVVTAGAAELFGTETGFSK